MTKNTQLDDCFRATYDTGGSENKSFKWADPWSYPHTSFDVVFRKMLFLGFLEVAGSNTICSRSVMLRMSRTPIGIEILGKVRVLDRWNKGSTNVNPDKPDTQGELYDPVYHRLSGPSDTIMF